MTVKPKIFPTSHSLAKRFLDYREDERFAHVFLFLEVVTLFLDAYDQNEIKIRHKD